MSWSTVGQVEGERTAYECLSSPLAQWNELELGQLVTAEYQLVVGAETVQEILE